MLLSEVEKAKPYWDPSSLYKEGVSVFEIFKKRGSSSESSSHMNGGVGKVGRVALKRKVYHLFLSVWFVRVLFIYNICISIISFTGRT